MTRIILFLALALILASLPATAANTIYAGTDIWQTQGDGRTYTDLNLPAGFFCAASAPFAGRVALAGVPIVTDPAGALGKADTVIERLGDTTFNASGIATVNAVVRAISFKSTAPITVAGCPGSAYWDVRSVATSTQTPFLITIRRSSPTAAGGTFDSTVVVTPKLIFTQQGSGLQRSLDQQPVTFTTQGAEWTHRPGAGGVTYGSPSRIDTNGDNVADTTVPATSNFAAGWSPFPQPGCSTSPCRVPIPHQAPQHNHWVQSPCGSGGFCPAIYDPVICSNGVIYSNSCYASLDCAKGCVQYGYEE
jgi:hypothetical protein